MIKWFKQWLTFRQMAKIPNQFGCPGAEGGDVKVPTGPPHCAECGEIIGQCACPHMRW